MTIPRYWMGEVPSHDDFGEPITTTFIDGRTAFRHSGQWAFMSPKSWRLNGIGKLGPGYGQKYTKNMKTGRWLKVEG